MTTKEKMETIIKKALGEMAAVDCSLLEYMEGLERGKRLFNDATLACREDVEAGKE